MQRMTWVLLTTVLAAGGLALHMPARGADESAAAKAKIPLRIADWEETLERVAAHKGKVVVLDAWSTSCPPCMKEFPNLVRLHKQYASQGLVCMSLACDYAGIKNKPPESYRDKVLAFLEKQEATFENILSSVPADELFEKKMQLSSIPAVYVFGRDGRLEKRFDNEEAASEDDNFSYEDVTKLVKQLLAK